MIHTDGTPTIANCGPIPGLDKPRGFDLVSQIVAYELGELDRDDAVELFQHLVDTGQAWSLQGSYGRTAAALIEAGLVVAPS